ncbi:energy transducer TonB [Cellulophaga sp. E16_2]|uniref:Outer membrane transport energization protein TonB n=1 Tax=Cellulophaga algicola (strain DSM 14237 / IC166 / ACAM 630) TaxID=688270 RepID=E6XE31_CELAD|nr:MULTISPECIES: energy transducer TonB [Cellulophaga]ADV48097.1 outer membrane transport energization protein TonB [Cellulophaga algicola DSM 14237]MBO0590542.1 energy transducer TonB [Cellulophaga sp. E16_2]
MSLLDTRHKKKSFTLTTVLLSLLLLVLFYVGLTYLDPPEENGISINFGTTEYGSGTVQPKEKIKSEPIDKPVVPPSQQEKVEEVVPEETASSEQPTEKVVTQDSEESLVIKQQKEAKRKADAAEKAAKTAADRVAREKQEAKVKAQKEQDAKKKKLDEMMGGLNQSDGSASGGEGNDNKAGDKGNPNGDPYATSYYGAPGSGNGTGGYGLNGRSLSGSSSVKQDCNEEGRVVVKIVVDRTGRVISATPGVKGTTNTNPCLMKPAEQTARSHSWKPDPNAPNQQVGFVVINFKLRD